MTSKHKNYAGRNFQKERVPDKISKAKRSGQMSTIHSSGTKIELQLIKELRSRITLDFETNVKGIPGKPDIVYALNKVCIFVDSDFWHGWQYPRWKHLLKNEFWRTKIEKNRARDRKITRLLRKDGWKVIRLWEHNIKKDYLREINKVLLMLKEKPETHEE